MLSISNQEIKFTFGLKLKILANVIWDKESHETGRNWRLEEQEKQKKKIRKEGRKEGKKKETVERKSL